MSAHRRDILCEEIPDKLGQNQGYHHECYQIFTSNIGCLKPNSNRGTKECQSGKHNLQGSLNKVLFGRH